MGKARFVRNMGWSNSNVCLYSTDDGFLVISGVNRVSIHETMAFAADENGNLTNGYSEVSSVRGTTSHQELLNHMGYELEINE